MPLDVFAPYQALLARLDHTPLADWVRQLSETLPAALQHGDRYKWEAAIEAFPAAYPSVLDFNNNAVQIGTATDLTAEEQAHLKRNLMILHPWRKGPFKVFGLHLDTEWRSDWKWDRIIPHLSPLAGRKILDVGSGNGYYGWRMLGEGADLVLGLDPFAIYVFQWLALRHLIPEALVPSINQLFILPFGIENFPTQTAYFDTVFSMGVLYHRRAPMDHLAELKTCLREGGELVLETLVVEGDVQTLLVPEGRYAQMRNVWFLPSVPMLESWLKKMGFKNIRTVDVTPTSTREQRPTDWMQFESLPHFLQADAPHLTKEGHPAPIRATILANR